MNKQKQPFTYYFNNPDLVPKFSVFEKTNAQNIYVSSEDDDFSRLNMYHSSFSKKHTLRNFGDVYESFVISTLNRSEENYFMNRFIFLENGILLPRVITSQSMDSYSNPNLEKTFHSQYQNLRQELPTMVEALFSNIDPPLDDLALKLNDFLNKQKGSSIQKYIRYPNPTKDKRGLISKAFDFEKVE